MNDQYLLDGPLLFTRCAAELTPGTGDFYVVRIDAIADPSPPQFSEEELNRDHRAEIAQLIEEMQACPSRS